ncbi:hypothetical protein [Deinococcus geothermalis]|uniref:Uncharacterized protein n=1 Tax=Deinococcus geothermalis (strain DSM 11300 / CIP 105573 / AG-3a) TaxID=319795 RepID=Q1IW12_DEIGD|nr:hypothetical protein [Deinococcus geothermalis]ABF46572.1 hypothetical protein Dgeo_2278 [Deinococcus geothermalis DSM 11300]
MRHELNAVPDEGAPQQRRALRCGADVGVYLHVGTRGATAMGRVDRWHISTPGPEGKGTLSLRREPEALERLLPEADP